MKLTDSQWLRSLCVDPSWMPRLDEIARKLIELERQRGDLADTLADMRKQIKNAIDLGATGPGFYEDLDETAHRALAKAEAA